jgi:hypothetical protein
MDHDRFDDITRFLTTFPSRRMLLRGSVAAVIGLTAGWVPGGPDAKKKQRKRKRKPELNAYGCVDVGKPCRGNDGLCCSGVCDGTKPRNGKKDRSRCVAHDTGGCLAGLQEPFCGGTDVPCLISGNTGFCNTTTGNAGFCTSDTECFACTKDADCIPFCGPHAACIVCGNECAIGTACTGPDFCSTPPPSADRRRPIEHVETRP